MTDDEKMVQWVLWKLEGLAVQHCICGVCGRKFDCINDQAGSERGLRARFVGQRHNWNYWTGKPDRTTCPPCYKDASTLTKASTKWLEDIAPFWKYVEGPTTGKKERT